VARLLISCESNQDEKQLLAAVAGICVEKTIQMEKEKAVLPANLCASVIPVFSVTLA
jgi:DNA-binding XRE family transcriptional regulator